MNEAIKHYEELIIKYDKQVMKLEQDNKRLKANEKFFADCITNALSYIYELKTNSDDIALDKIIKKLTGRDK